MTDASHSSEKRLAAGTSVLASGGLLCLKVVAALFTGSLALIGEVVHSLIDLGATIVTWFAVKWGDKPADDDHHFGHSKVEAVAALAETILLLITALALAGAAIYRLMSGVHDVTFSWIAVLLIVITVLIDFNRSRLLGRTADKTGSEALAADALHFHTDMWSSLAVLAGLGLMAMGITWGDSAMALVVSAFIGWSGWALGTRTIATLVDRAPEGIAERVRSIAENEPGVLDVARVRVRPSGAGLFIDVGVRVSRLMPLTSVAETKQNLGDAISKAVSNADVTVTADSVELDSESVVDRVMLLARHDGLAIHHVLVQQVGRKLAVSYDMEVDGATSLAAAHDVATRLEGAIRHALGEAVEVETHIEPLPPQIIVGQDAPDTDLATFETKLRTLGASEPTLRDVHNVRLRQTPAGYIIHYHCRFAPDTKVADAHAAIDRLEDKLKAANPTLLRVVAHAEPVKTADAG